MGKTVWAARIIPVLLFGIIGYVSWVITVTVGERHYLNQGRRGAGISILTIYWILFVFVVLSFSRLLAAVGLDPGYIHTGDDAVAKPSRRQSTPAPQLSDFYNKDVFVCNPDGTPRWCATCRIWRPDRSRHCREKDRCLFKMDHFCPWVGGIVSETTMKFFIQFNTYTVLYAFFDWVVAAACIADARSGGGKVNGNWIAVVIMGLFFMGLTGGIGTSAWINAITNHTTPENVAEPAGHRWTLAIRVPDGEVPASGVPTITFPLLPNGSSETLQDHLNGNARSSDSSTSKPEDSQHGPTFAIVQSDPYSNPWDCGGLRNWKQVMGRMPWDWVLPLGYGGTWSSGRTYGLASSNEGQPPSFFPTGLDVEAMKAKAGLRSTTQEEDATYESAIERRKTFPYLLGGAGAPKKQWASSLEHHKERRRERRGAEK